MRSILSLPPVLQGVWRDVYAARCGVSGSISFDDAESCAWEAVRRANGGEMPEVRAELVVLGPHEPTDEEMIVALAPIAAKLCHALHASPDVQQRIAEACGASWKAARAWGRK